MSPGGHLITSAATCGAVYAATGSPELAAGLAVGGFLIDVDHVLDYVLLERRREMTPKAFLRHYLEGRVERAVLCLHSYELGALLALLAWANNWVWLWGYVLGMGLHLPLDIIFNSKFQQGSLVPFYSFAWRARAGFAVARLCAPRRLAPLTESFWVVFFRGSRLESAELPDVRSAPAPDATRAAAR